MKYSTSHNTRLSGSLRCTRSAQIPLRGTSDSRGTLIITMCTGFFFTIPGLALIVQYAIIDITQQEADLGIQYSSG